MLSLTKLVVGVWLSTAESLPHPCNQWHDMLLMVLHRRLEVKAMIQSKLRKHGQQAMHLEPELCITGATTSQSLAVLKKTGHIAFVLNENINYFKVTAG